jgi:hypothetical protein
MSQEKPKFSRRDFLRAAVVAVMTPLVSRGVAEASSPAVPDAPHQTYIPEVEVAASPEAIYKQKLFDVLQQAFPLLEEVEIQSDGTNIEGFLKSTLHWLERLQPEVQNGVAKVQESNIQHHMYQDTVAKISFIFDDSPGLTMLHTNESNVTAIEMHCRSNDPGSLTGELIHLYQADYHISTGVSAINCEAASTLIDLVLLKEWVTHTDAAWNNPDQQLLMPIYDRSTGERIENPTYDQFMQFLHDEVSRVSDSITEVLNPIYKPEFLGEESLGQSQQLHRSITFLQDRLDYENFPQQEYSAGPERQAATFASVMSRYVKSLEDVVVLTSFINHGQDPTTIAFGTSEDVIQAYKELKAKNLIASVKDWQENIQQFSQVTVEGLAFNAAFALKSPYGSNKHLTLEAYMLLTQPSVDKTFFDTLPQEDLPTATLYFPYDKDGQRVWYQKDIPVMPKSDGRTILYDIELPSSVLVRNDYFVPWYEELEGKQMVLRVTQPNILGVGLGTIQDFEVEGLNLGSSVTVQSAELPAESAAEALAPSAAPTKEAQAAQVQTSYDQLSDDNKAKFDAIRARLDKRQSQSTIMR